MVFARLRRERGSDGVAVDAGWFTGCGRGRERGEPLAPKQPHFKPKAKRVIYMFQAGAPSHLDFDRSRSGQAQQEAATPELLKDYRAAFINPNSALLGPKFKFSKHGQAGTEVANDPAEDKRDRG